MGEVVSRHATVEARQALLDLVAVLRVDRIEQAVDLAHAIAALLDRFELASRADRSASRSRR
jgi:2-keto-3-deoxy-6-phosphogluconate aldolase